MLCLRLKLFSGFVEVSIKGDGVMKIDRMDHLVLTVKDIDATCDFYSRVPGLNAVTFREGRKARHSAGKK